MRLQYGLYGGQVTSGPLLHGSGLGGPLSKTDPSRYTLRFSDDTAKASVVAAGSGLVDYHVRYENRLVLLVRILRTSTFLSSIAASVQSLFGFSSNLRHYHNSSAFTFGYYCVTRIFDFSPLHQPIFASQFHLSNHINGVRNRLLRSKNFESICTSQITLAS